MPGIRVWTSIALAGAAALATAPSAGAVSADTAIGNLNAQRQVNKIPAGIVHNPTLSQGCAQHDNYMHLNNQLTHDEVASNPGFTATGATAGMSSVLAAGAGPWNTRNDNPWETSPIHLSQTLDPALAISGYDESFGYSCLVTVGQPTSPPPGRVIVYTYPGPRAKIYTAERAAESPYTPGELIGIPKGTFTGPYLYIFVDGPDRFGLDKTRITAAGLRRKSSGKKGGKGKKLLRIDGTNPMLGPYIPPGGMLIPRRVLDKGIYEAAVSLLTPQGQRLTKKWSFRAK